MKLSDFDFELPEGLIATRPPTPRSAGRLLVAQNGQISDHHVVDLVDILRPGDRLILNDTKVIPARLFGQRRRISDQGETHAKVEITLLNPDEQGHWRALAKPAKRLKIAETVEFGHGLSAVVRDKPSGEVTLAFNLTAEAFDA
ncbi:MAG: S-adenosylmethionine:tRNA ribosyltransferase-isomerase, partial [Alphaproteobacteria bacterium]|nr:S-adenosylmethionine:tRNA ribosyltransferase-isomerase [Alphaproteobacteria bacterium]